MKVPPQKNNLLSNPLTPPQPDDILLLPKTVAEILGGEEPLSVDTLTVWRSTKRYNLKYIKVGRFVRYWRSEVMRFLREREQNPG